MRIIFVFGAILGAVLPGGASAQRTASADVGVRVVQTLTLRGLRDLDFGDVVAPPPGATTTRQVARTDAGAGQFELAGGGGQQVQVSFRAPSRLQRSGGTATLPLELALYATETPAAAGGAERVLPEATVRLRANRHYFILAGTLTVRDLATNPAGTYSGEFELTVAYTSL